MCWKPIRELIETDINLGDLRFFPKLSMKHANPTVWEKMKVNIAAQTLSNTVALELQRTGYICLSEFVLLMDRWFDHMNTGWFDAKRRAKPDMEIYKPNDEHTTKRLEWLGKEFPNYFGTWKNRVMTRTLPGNQNEIDRSSMLLSTATECGLLMTTKSIVDLIQEAFQQGADYVMTRRINQDPLESHFGHQRQRGRRSDAPTVLMFGYNVRAINTFRSVPGSNVSSS